VRATAREIIERNYKQCAEKLFKIFYVSNIDIFIK